MVAGVAQLVEHHLAKVDVEGSNPFARSILFFKDKESLSKKVVNVYDKVFECKFPKNSFERMRGVRTRICILDEEDNKIINKIRKKKKNLKR